MVIIKWSSKNGSQIGVKLSIEDAFRCSFLCSKLDLSSFNKIPMGLLNYFKAINNTIII